MDKRKRIAKQIKKDLSKIKKTKEFLTIDEIVTFFTEKSDGIELTEAEQARFFSKRAEVLNHIIRNPGTFLDHMEKELGMNSYILILHLNILLHFNLIKKKEINNFDMYYHSDINYEDAINNYHTLKKEFYDKLRS